MMNDYEDQSSNDESAESVVEHLEYISRTTPTYMPEWMD